MGSNTFECMITIHTHTLQRNKVVAIANLISDVNFTIKYKEKVLHSFY